MLRRFLYSVLLFPLTAVVLVVVTSWFYVCGGVPLAMTLLVTALPVSWLWGSKLVKNGWEAVSVIVIFIMSLLLLVIILAVLNEARSSSPGAEIKMNTNNMRSQAEIYYNDNFSYEGVCDDEAMQKLKEAVQESQSKNQQGSQVRDFHRCLGRIPKMLLPKEEFKVTVTPGWFSCNETGEEYAIESYVPSQETYFCVDSTGRALINENSIGSATKCISE